MTTPRDGSATPATGSGCATRPATTHTPGDQVKYAQVAGSAPAPALPQTPARAPRDTYRSATATGDALPYAPAAARPNRASATRRVPPWQAPNASATAYRDASRDADTTRWESGRPRAPMTRLPPWVHPRAVDQVSDLDTHATDALKRGITRRARRPAPALPDGTEKCVSTEHPSGWWFTIADICHDLKVAEDEYLEWASKGQAPIPHFGADGIGRVHRADYEAWCDYLTFNDDHGSEGES